MNGHYTGQQIYVFEYDDLVNRKKQTNFMSLVTIKYLSLSQEKVKTFDI
jgi:hypothetical protein